MVRQVLNLPAAVAAELVAAAAAAEPGLAAVVVELAAAAELVAAAVVDAAVVEVLVAVRLDLAEHMGLEEDDDHVQEKVRDAVVGHCNEVALVLDMDAFGLVLGLAGVAAAGPQLDRLSRHVHQIRLAGEVAG